MDRGLESAAAAHRPRERARPIRRELGATGRLLRRRRDGRAAGRLARSRGARVARTDRDASDDCRRRAQDDRSARARGPSLIALLLAAVVAQAQPQVRDARPAAALATGRIAGVVVADDAQARPLRRARVTLNGQALTIGRSVITADDGSFAFDR